MLDFDDVCLDADTGGGEGLAAAMDKQMDATPFGVPPSLRRGVDRARW